jgi:hypothetical protein
MRYWVGFAVEKNICHSHYPLPPHVYMKSYAENAVTLYSAAKSAFGLQKVTGSPKLSPELERLIFEMCTLDSPEVCTVLVLVAKRCTRGQTMIPK